MASTKVDCCVRLCKTVFCGLLVSQHKNSGSRPIFLRIELGTLAGEIVNSDGEGSKYSSSFSGIDFRSQDRRNRAPQCTASPTACTCSKIPLTAVLSTGGLCCKLLLE